MDKREFFKLLGVGVVAAIVAPKLLIPKKGSEFKSYVGPNGIRMVIAVDPIFDTPGINNQQFILYFKEKYFKEK